MQNSTVSPRRIKTCSKCGTTLAESESSDLCERCNDFWNDGSIANIARIVTTYRVEYFIDRCSQLPPAGPRAMLVRIPPKYSVAEVVGYLKGKSAIAVARQFGGRKRNFNGEQFLLDDRDQDLGLRLTGKEVRRLSGV